MARARQTKIVNTVTRRARRVATQPTKTQARVTRVVSRKRKK
jgi:hypothetical protein